MCAYLILANSKPTIVWVLLPFDFGCLTDSQRFRILKYSYLLMANKLIVCSLVPLKFDNFQSQSQEGGQVCSGFYDHRLLTTVVNYCIFR